MAKKTFDIKSTLAAPTRSFSVEDIEAATRQIHQPEKPVLLKEKKEKVAGKFVGGDANDGPKAKTAPAMTKPSAKKVQQKASPASGKKEKAAALPPVFQKRRDPDAPPVRKVRLSVDVLPETHKRLKIRAIENDSDLGRYVEMLIERDLAG